MVDSFQCLVVYVMDLYYGSFMTLYRSTMYNENTSYYSGMYINNRLYTSTFKSLTNQHI